MSYDRSTFFTFYMCSTLSEKIGFESFLGLFINMICNFPETFKLCHLYKKVNLSFSIFIRIGKFTLKKYDDLLPGTGGCPGMCRDKNLRDCLGTEIPRHQAPAV